MNDKKVIIHLKNNHLFIELLFAHEPLHFCKENIAIFFAEIEKPFSLWINNCGDAVLTLTETA